MPAISRVVLECEPYNAETPHPGENAGQTPVGAFYVRTHFPIPVIEDTAAWRLSVGGAVRRARDWSLADLTRLPAQTLTVTLECAGNGRRRLEPRPPGTPWGDGAVGTATFEGVPLRSILEEAGVLPETIEVVFHGSDRGVVDGAGEIAYARSLPIATAREPHVLVAHHMEGRPLAPEHGFPLRLLVPGWYAMASVKWLSRIEAVTEPFAGHFQRRDYLYEGERGTPDGTPVTRMRVRALIGWPAEGDVVARAPAVIRGTAWSGSGPVAAVEVSTDSGMTWTAAELGPAVSDWAARRWRLPWTPARGGEITLIARARDASGEVQPTGPVWNRRGYGNNQSAAVRVTVVD